MSVRLSSRLAQAKPSATLALNTKAKALKAQGKNILNLAVGEPDFDTPDFIKAAAVEAIQAGFTKYTAVPGILELRQAICEKLKHDNQLTYDPSEVIVSTGLKQALFNLLLALLNDGDEVIIPAPYWVSYPEMVLIAGGKPVTVVGRLENNLKITPEDLAKAITPRTKLIILNSPSNPSGVSYSADELQGLAEVLLEHPNVVIASDDMYEKMYWGEAPFVNILNVAPALKDRTLVMNGVSKTYAMTGWRIGYAAGPAQIIQAMDLIQSQSTSSANSIAQKAAVAALTGPQDCVINMMESFRSRYNFLCESLKNVPGLVLPKATGTFYFYPYVQALIARLGLKDDIAFCDYLLDKLEMAVLPGSVCGTPGFIRLSFATDMAVLKETVRRFQTL